MTKNKAKEYPLCLECGYKHFSYNDGFDYLDCMAYYRANLEPKEVKEARESQIEIWDAVKKVWVPKKDFYQS